MKLNEFFKTTTKQAFKESSWKLQEIKDWKPFNFVLFYQDKFKLVFGCDDFEIRNILKNERQKYFLYSKIKRFIKRYNKNILREYIKWSIKTAKIKGKEINLQDILTVPNTFLQEFINNQINEQTKLWSDFKRWKK